MAEKENKDFNNPAVDVLKLTNEQKQAGQEISEIMKNGFDDENHVQEVSVREKEKQKETKKQKEQEYQKIEKEYYKKLSRKDKKAYKQYKKQNDPATLRKAEKQEKRKELYKNFSATRKKILDEIARILRNVIAFVTHPIKTVKALSKADVTVETIRYDSKNKDTNDVEKINDKIINKAKEKGFDAIIKDEKSTQEKKIYFSKEGYDAYASINKFGKITDVKSSKSTPATKEDADNINFIIQQTRKNFTAKQDYNTVLCENFQKEGYNINIGADGKCAYISKDDKNFVVKNHNSVNPEIMAQSIEKTLDIDKTISDISKEIRENTEKDLSEKLDCKVKIGENKKGTFIEIEEKGKYSIDEIKDYLKTEEKLNFITNDKNYQLQNKDGKLILIEQDEEKEAIYESEKEISEKLKEVGILADKQIIQVDKNGNLQFTEEQLNNKLCQKLEEMTMVMSSFQEYSQEEKKSMRSQKQIATTIKNVQGLKPGQSFEREQDGFYISATCGPDGACVVLVKGKNESSEEVSLTGAPKDITAKLEEALVKATVETDTADFDNRNHDWNISENPYEGIQNQEMVYIDNSADEQIGDKD